LLFFIPAHALAGSVENLVDKGNRAFAKGKYGEALEAYEEAAVDSPESPYIYFNKGTAYYRKEDYAKAKEAFEQAAVKSKSIKLESQSKYNLGLCSFREAERQQDSDLNKALEACAKSIQYFQESRELAPDFKEAAENIEVVRLTMKSILDEMNKQKEAAKKQQEAMKNAAEQMKKVIKKQQELLERNKYLSEEKIQKGESPELGNKIADLAEDQSDLRQKTLEIAEKLPLPQQTQTAKSVPASSVSAKKHLENAAVEQKLASEKLEKKQTMPAQANQQKALDELKEALEPPKDNKQNQNQNRQKGEKKQEGAQSPENRPQEKKEGEKKEQQSAQLQDNAENILDEEKKNKRERRRHSAGSFREVDKDW
jgi:hypothetical protein